MTAPPSVCVVTELYYPEETSTGYFMTGIAESIAREFRVTVVCGQPTYSARGTIAPRREHRNGVDIERCVSTTFPKDSILLRLVNAITFSIAVFFRILSKLRSNDVILVVTNPPILPYAVAFAAKFRGARMWLLIHDVYPDVLVASGVSQSQSVMVRLLRSTSRWLYGQADRIIVLGRDMRTLVRQTLKSKAREPVVIPNWGDPDLIEPMPRKVNPILQQHGLEHHFVVQFMGNIGRTHGVDTLLDAAMQLRDDHNVHFLFVGWGGRKKWLEEQIKKESLANVTILPACPRDELSNYLNACDVSVIAFRRGMCGISVPSRMYNVMAAGKPILAVAHRASELARVIREEGIGWVTPPGDVTALVNQICHARDAPEDRKKMGAAGRRAVEEKYNRALIGLQYCELLRSEAVRDLPECALDLSTY